MAVRVASAIFGKEPRQSRVRILRLAVQATAPTLATRWGLEGEYVVIAVAAAGGSGGNLVAERRIYKAEVDKEEEETGVGEEV